MPGSVAVDQAFVGQLRPRRRRHAGERVEEIADAEILQRAAEEHRREVALGKSFAVEGLAGVADQIELVADGRRRRAAP